MSSLQRLEGRYAALQHCFSFVCTVVAGVDDAEAADEAKAGSEGKSTNSANDPTEPRFTLQYWNYYAFDPLATLQAIAEERCTAAELGHH
jgi:hypothetical protein